MTDPIHRSPRPVALVTGASRGLGFLIARELADRGHDLVICARSADGLADAAADLRRHGGAVETVAADVGVKEQAEGVVAAARERFGRLDVLVTNAGIIQVGPAEEFGARDYAEIMDAVFWGALHPTLAAMPLLRESRGRILAITSVGGKLPAPHLLPYTAAKHAQVGFAEGLRVEAAGQGVSVTVGVPGLMRTGSTRNALFAGDRERERQWFTAAASLPVLSMDAERAARRLVKAALRGQPEIILTPLAKVGVRAHALAPSTSLRVVSLVTRLLPGASGSGKPVPGHATGRQPGWFDRLTGRDRRAAERWHELDDQVPAS
ncbi:SDR family NAD(P)-dependent oxidoreductase [Pseudonocardia sp.]|uniref:SDR family NAD(P)-dependent oxidoreductase n=1 Tax=Pseudonocardia sp. TaxID=60912 RepID=UPI0031FBB4D3